MRKWMKRIAAALGTLYMVGCIGAGNNSTVLGRGPQFFPEVQGIDLTGASVRMPAVFSGGNTLLVIAYEREQQSAVDTWINNEKKLTQIIGPHRFYELPVIRASSSIFRWWVNNGMRQGIPGESQRRSVVTIYTDVEDFNSKLGLGSKDIAAILVGPAGQVLGIQTGLFSDEKATTLAANLRRT